MVNILTAKLINIQVIKLYTTAYEVHYTTSETEFLDIQDI
jgi:hypothetical protein